MRFQVENMTCGGCARSVTRAIQKLDPAAEVAVDLDRKSVEVRSDRAPSDLVVALGTAGFPAVAT